MSSSSVRSVSNAVAPNCSGSSVDVIEVWLNNKHVCALKNYAICRRSFVMQQQYGREAIQDNKNKVQCTTNSCHNQMCLAAIHEVSWSSCLALRLTCTAGVTKLWAMIFLQLRELEVHCTSSTKKPSFSLRSWIISLKLASMSRNETFVFAHIYVTTSGSQLARILLPGMSQMGNFKTSASDIELK